MKRCAGGIEYELTRKAVKNLNLRLRPDGSVTVSIPKRVTLAKPTALWSRMPTGIRQARQRLDCRPGIPADPRGVPGRRPVLAVRRPVPAAAGSDRGDHTPGRGTLPALSGASLLPGPPAHPMAEPSAGTGAPGDDRRSGAPAGGVLSPPSGRAPAAADDLPLGELQSPHRGTAFQHPAGASAA